MNSSELQSLVGKIEVFENTMLDGQEALYLFVLMTPVSSAVAYSPPGYLK